jgi:excisionase family DNA binding protein
MGCNNMQTQSSNLIKVEEQAKLLGISTRHLHAITRQRLVPVVRLGRSIRYNPAAVAAAIEKNLTQRALA